jgi:anti-anti-sigma factor
MKLKINTKEKFHAITVVESTIPATMTEELSTRLLNYLQNDVKNVVLIIKDIETIDDAAANALVNIQQKFYENNASFVICEMQKTVEKQLREKALLDLINLAPTENEAWDIVQMEEIEREFLQDDKNL